MVDVLWDDSAPESALNVIHKYVGSLRRLLEPGLAARAPGSYLQARGDGYVFQARGSGLDLLTFRGLVADAQAASAARHEQEALDRLVEVLGLWRGPAAEGVGHGTWGVALFSALDDEYYDACLAAADLSLRLEQPQRVSLALRRAAPRKPRCSPARCARRSNPAGSWLRRSFPRGRRLPRGWPSPPEMPFDEKTALRYARSAQALLAAKLEHHGGTGEAPASA
jgi:DNA-binding SARP family transcriptional activator